MKWTVPGAGLPNRDLRVTVGHLTVCCLRGGSFVGAFQVSSTTSRCSFRHTPFIFKTQTPHGNNISEQDGHRVDHLRRSFPAEQISGRRQSHVCLLPTCPSAPVHGLCRISPPAECAASTSAEEPSSFRIFGLQPASSMTLSDFENQRRH